MNDQSVEQSGDQDSNTGQIKIIATPAGEAPEEIREAWVGLIFPCHPVLGYSEGDVGALSYEPTEHNRRVVSVPQDEVIRILASVHPDAAQWWRNQGYPTPGGYFSFGEREIEVISGMTHQQIREWRDHDDFDL